MFRLANNNFKEHECLKKMATECLTETIREHLKKYFLNGYEKEDKEMLYTKVNLSKVIDLLPYELWCEIEGLEINAELFLKKKVAEFMNILNAEESITPDIFIEYLLYRMIITESEEHITESEKLKKMKPVLRSLIEEYSKNCPEEYLFFYKKDELDNYMDYEGNIISKEYYNKVLTKYQKEYIEKTMKNITCLPKMSIEDDSLVFWNWDFAFFEDFGFEFTLKNISNKSVGVMIGYGEEYVKNIFKKTNIKVPSFI